MYEYIASKSLFERAQLSIPGGVNSPVRAFKSVGGTPLFLSEASGAYLFDADKNKFAENEEHLGQIINSIDAKLFGLF